jgi:hypothetical protein
MATILLKELVVYGSIGTSNPIYSKLKKFFDISLVALPDHRDFVGRTTSYWLEDSTRNADEATRIINSILDLMSFEQATQEKISEQKLFASAQDKLKEAGRSFEAEDYVSVMNNLNTALELVLKDKLEIPTTIKSINTAKILDVLISNRVPHYLFLDEAKKHVLQIDNETKHRPYNPSKADCIIAIKSMEDLMAKLKSTQFNLNSDVKAAIYKDL